MTPRLRSAVMAGLVPATYVFVLLYSSKDVDARDKPGHNEFMTHTLPQAGAIAARSTGLSMIGRLMIAEMMPSTTDSHHTTLYEPVLVNKSPPSQTPRKPPS